MNKNSGRGRRLVFAAVGLVIMLFLLLTVLLDFIVDYQWFEEVGYTSVFMAGIINKFRIGLPVFA